MVLKCFLKSLISSVCSQSLVGKSNLTFTVVHLYDFGFHLVTNMYKIS